MWKIFIDYPDKSKLTLTGKHKDIPLRLAEKYYNEYANTICKAVYQRYPKKDYAAVGLFEKIEQLRMEMRMNNADRIRAMENEELAEFLAKEFCHGIGEELIKQWLESEVENG